MNERIEQRPTRREVLPYNGIRANTQPLCPEFWTQALLRMQRCILAGMEFFPASSRPPWDVIRPNLDVTDYMVLLLAGRYGSVTEDGIGYTEREYQALALCGPGFPQSGCCPNHVVYSQSLLHSLRYGGSDKPPTPQSQNCSNESLGRATVSKGRSRVGGNT